MEGGGKEGTVIHDRIVERLQSEFNFSEEEARAIKMMLYDEAKENVSSDEPGYNLKRAEYMEKQLTKRKINKISKENIEEYVNKRKDFLAKKTKAGKKASKKASKKAVKKTSKKASKKSKAGKKKSSKKASKKPKKKTSKK
jgi:hypothetical protein